MSVSIFEAIETMIWKLLIAPVVRIVSKFFETTRAIRTTNMDIRLKNGNLYKIPTFATLEMRRNWAKLSFAKTSGTVTGESGKIGQ